MNLDALLPNAPVPPPNLIYSYADGSGNIYYITKEFIQYKPVIPIQSSSGVYCGGKAAQKLLNIEQFTQIKVLIQQVRKNHSDFTSNRVKGSGHLKLHLENEVYLLGYQTHSQQKLETAFKAIFATA
ncbi:hypothetical protein [Aureispira sp. CCB-QB1]|uniref:hypothetical protein n=1 Tax=Aureispira sp. CCB-QB1 TaxID=1313421 RepID=UPI0006980BE3|nr:hypothetical protein [Aureispira sp. CCB-QB1]